jgi:hypothetical protein
VHHGYAAPGAFCKALKWPRPQVRDLGPPERKEMIYIIYQII